MQKTYFIQFSMTQDERKGLILCLKIEFSDGLEGGAGIIDEDRYFYYNNSLSN